MKLEETDRVCSAGGWRLEAGGGAGGGVPPEMAGETQKGRASLEEEEASGKEEAEGRRSTKAFCARREVSKSQMEEGPSPEETSCSSPSLFPSSFLQPPAPHLRSGLTLLRLDLSADGASSAPTLLPGSSPSTRDGSACIVGGHTGAQKG